MRLLIAAICLTLASCSPPQEMNEVTPQSAPEHLLFLYDRLRGQGHEIPEAFGCTAQELEIFTEHYPRELPQELIDFLCATLPKAYLDIGVYKTKPPKALLQEQLDAVPLEGNMKHGFFGLGWWTGDTDGDGWLYDLEDGRIYAVQIYHNDEETKQDVIDLAYQSFDSFDAWVDFLEQECREREWLD